MYALCDGTAFFASCEKIFDPAIRNKPVLVAGSNDGIVIALCPIAKRLGLKKFEPVFMQQELIRKTGAIVRSANFELYGELSQRMHTILAEYGHSHPYSIDESFVRLDFNLEVKDYFELGRSIRRRMWDELRVPLCVGFGHTLTLAKAANHASKRIPGYRGVAVIDTAQERVNILSQMNCDDVWGIGRRIGKRLGIVFNIKSAIALSQSNRDEMRSVFNINVANTIDELNGIPQLYWDDVRPSKREIFSTRSVGRPIQDIETLKRVITSHAISVCRKAREQRSLIKQLVIFARTSPFKEHASASVSELITFYSPTSCYKKIAAEVARHVESMYRPGHDFVKIGAGAISLLDEINSIVDLFDPKKDDVGASLVMDSINKRFGRGAMTLASTIDTDAATFLVNRNQLSPPYLTSWNHLPKVFCK